MRAVILVLILAVVVLIGAIATGFLDINQVRGARAPDVDATHNGVVAKGGQAPAFDVQTGSVAVGTRSANVTVPVPEVRVNPAGGTEQPAAPAEQQAAQANQIQGNGL